MAKHKRSAHEYVPSTNTEGGPGRVWDCYATKDRDGWVVGVAWESLPTEVSAGFLSFDLMGCRKVKTLPCGMRTMTAKAEATAITLVKDQLYRDGLATKPASAVAA
ncbi:MAG: hypothetical protein KAX77_01230 [Xanthomonadales bacterium]|nr:hypothetical protein [Xanthomonadales bacterium]